MAAPAKGKSLTYWLGKKRFSRRRQGDETATPYALSTLLSALEPKDFPEQRQRCPVTDSQWRDAVGERVARRTYPKQLEKDGTLVVLVTHSVWSQELTMLSKELCERLRAQGHYVKSLRFVSGVMPKYVGAFERSVVRKVPNPVPLSDRLRAELQSIDDDKLRETIATTMALSLAKGFSNE